VVDIRLFPGRQISNRSRHRQSNEFIQSQLEEDVVDFKKPRNSLEDVFGNPKLSLFCVNN